MKKLLWIIPLCLLTCGCFSYNKTLICSISEKYDGINTEINVTTDFKKGYASSATAIATMKFESNEAAKEYFDTYKGDSSNIELKNNTLIVSSNENFTNDEETKTREQIKTYFENSGYTCK